MSIETLRGLSRAYAAGDLDRASYLRERRALLERITSGEFPAVPWLAPEPESRTVFPDELDDGDTTQEILPSSAMVAGDGGRKRFWLLAGGTIFATAIAAIAWFLADADGRGNAAGVATVAPVMPDAAFDPLAAFLAENIWSSQHIEGLLKEWSHLDPAEREALRGGKSARQFKQAVLAHLKAESALIELGDAEEALDTQEQLLDALERLGLSDEQVERARMQWTAMREQHLDRINAAPDDTGGETTDAATPPLTESDTPAGESAARSAVD